MNFTRINKLISKAIRSAQIIKQRGKTPALLRIRDNYVSEIKRKYGLYLTDVLFEVYDEYCADDDLMPIEAYLTPSGVPVEVDDLPGVHYRVKMISNPLRIELVNNKDDKSEVVWQAA
ncbi:MAG: hypothetical protein JXQ90_17865 [Cyclobacteriaceae bacterium]